MHETNIFSSYQSIETQQIQLIYLFNFYLDLLLRYSNLQVESFPLDPWFLVNHPILLLDPHLIPIISTSTSYCIDSFRVFSKWFPFGSWRGKDLDVVVGKILLDLWSLLNLGFPIDLGLSMIVGSLYPRLSSAVGVYSSLLPIEHFVAGEKKLHQLDLTKYKLLTSIVLDLLKLVLTVLVFSFLIQFIIYPKFLHCPVIRSIPTSGRLTLFVSE